MMDEPRAQISRVCEIAREQLFTRRIQLEEFPLRSVLVEPRHARERERSGAARHDDLQPLVQATSAGLLAAMMQPQDAERENAVDNRRALVLAHADDGPRLRSAH